MLVVEGLMSHDDVVRVCVCVCGNHVMSSMMAVVFWLDAGDDAIGGPQV